MRALNCIHFTVALIIITTLPTFVYAETRTYEIREDYFIQIEISFSYGDYLKLNYTVRVTDGPKIDIFLMDMDNFRYYEEGKQFKYLSAMSDLNTSYAKNSITLDQHGTYYLVFDNTEAETKPPWNMKDDVAKVTYDIDKSIVTRKSLDSPPNFSSNNNTRIADFAKPISAIVIVLIIGGGIVVLTILFTAIAIIHMLNIRIKVQYDGHDIEIKPYGTEIITYDGKVVSSKITMFGGTHIFNVNENGENIQYEVKIRSRLNTLSNWREVIREGKIIYTDQ